MSTLNGERKNKGLFPLKIVAGITFILAGFIIGRFAQLIFFTYFEDHSIRTLAILLYLLSWGPTILGIWWVGREMAVRINRYFSPLFYTKKMREHLRKRKKLRRNKKW